MNWYYTNNEMIVGPLSGETMMELRACGMLRRRKLINFTLSVI